MKKQHNSISNIYFFRKGRKYCFNIEDKIYELNRNNLEFLKENITLPLKSIFSDLPVSKVDKILIELQGDIAEAQIEEIKNKDNIKRYTALITKKEKIKKKVLNNKEGQINKK